MQSVPRHARRHPLDCLARELTSGRFSAPSRATLRASSDTSPCSQTVMPWFMWPQFSRRTGTPPPVDTMQRL